MDLKDYQKAKEAYDEILTEYSDSMLCDYAQYQLGIALFKMANYDAAMLAFQSLLGNFPKSSLKEQAQEQLALSYFRKGNFQMAFDAFQKVISVIRRALWRLRRPFRQVTVFLISVNIRKPSPFSGKR